MELENQYCTRSQAERLIELGVKNETQEGEFYYSTILSNGNEFKAFRAEGEDCPPKMLNPIKLYSVAELGELIPMHIALPYKDFNSWYDPNTGNNNNQGLYMTEAEARAAALIKTLSDGKI